MEGLKPTLTRAVRTLKDRSGLAESYRAVAAVAAVLSYLHRIPPLSSRWSAWGVVDGGGRSGVDGDGEGRRQPPVESRSGVPRISRARSRLVAHRCARGAPDADRRTMLRPVAPQHVTDTVRTAGRHGSSRGVALILRRPGACRP